MKDFIKKYHKNKLAWNLWVVAASIVTALSINFFLIDWTNVWQNLKASVLNSTENVVQNGDIYLANNWNNAWVFIWKQMSNVDNISFSIVYNPDEIEINSIDSNLWDIINISNEPWISSIIISLEQSRDLNINQEVLNIKYKKYSSEITQINLINSNFSDSDWGKYNLTTSWLNL